jgi:hypothetical protein
MGSKAAAQGPAPLKQAMAKTTDFSALCWLARGLPSVATGMEPKDAAGTLTEVLTKTTSSYPERL